MMIRRSLSPLAICTFAVVGFFGNGNAVANAIIDASVEVGIDELRFSFDDPNAILAWEDQWFGESRASVTDNLSPVAPSVESFLGDEGTIAAVSQSARVHSTAGYSVVDGENLA